MSCSCTGVVISARSGRRSTLAVRPSWSAWSQAGTAEVSSVASRTTGSTGALGFIVMTSSVLSWYEGMSTRAGEAEPHEHVVEAGLEQAQQVLTRHARLAACLRVVVAELLLEHAVV